MKVVIAGSRDIIYYEAVQEAVKEAGFEITEVVSGGARGVDTLGERWALDNGIAVRRFPANWAKYGPRAGYMRNVEMEEYGDALIAVWDGASPGTEMTIDLFKTAKKPVHVKIVAEDYKQQYLERKTA